LSPTSQRRALPPDSALAGRLTLTVEDETHLAGPGDTVLFCGDREHRCANEGGGQVRLAMVVSTPALGS